MDSISAVTVLLVLFAFGDVVAERTKGIISMVLVVSIALLIGFWCGLPTTIVNDSKVLSLGSFAAALLVISVGTMIDFAELIREWRVVAIALLSILAISLLVFLAGVPLIGKSMAITGAPIVMGGSVAVIIMTTALKAKGIADLAVWCVLLYIMHKFVGIPIASVMLKKEAARVAAAFRENALESSGHEDIKENTEAHAFRIIPLLPSFLPRCRRRLYCLRKYVS